MAVGSMTRDDPCSRSDPVRTCEWFERCKCRSKSNERCSKDRRIKTKGRSAGYVNAIQPSRPARTLRQLPKRNSVKAPQLSATIQTVAMPTRGRYQTGAVAPLNHERSAVPNSSTRLEGHGAAKLQWCRGWSVMRRASSVFVSQAVRCVG